ncbi:MAG: hypothetical protein K0U24_00115 [Gammaproteobacteria bacterium]|nr:hypothetical protein [Gammaproteobacteria bacterium]MCH9717610.1 hypothetical protein [Gammaproteobacteria bacterium]MCH9762631.1 hypothetical protein [Gammaproteobacteria bacterium]
MILAGCSPQNETSYSGNPKALQEAMKQCPQHAPKHVTCEQLSDLASRMNQLAYKLRSDQQAYGKDVLSLQETITAQRSTLEKNPNQIALQHNLKQNERHLQERLAVVRWLASPGQQ